MKTREDAIVRNFVFFNPTRILFGAGMEEETGRQAALWGKKALLHYGGGSIMKNGVYQKVTQSLREHGVSWVELGGVQPNPRLSLVREGIDLCRAQGVDLVLAVGGGSVIDSSKAIAAGVCYPGDIWACYIDPSKTVTQALPVGVVLTIPAAGSESSSGSVITNEDGWLKRPCEGEALYPRFAIINPETNYTLPPYQTACGCADIMAHLMERYFTSVVNVDASDRMIEGLLRTMLYYGPMALREPDNYDVRAEINWAGTLAHNNLLDRGRIGDWASHNIEHELSGIYDIAHGAGLAIVFPAWMRYVYQNHLDRFVQFAVRVMGVDLAFSQREEIAREGIDRLERFFQRMGLPTRLKEGGIGDDRLQEMAEKAHSVGNLEQLNCEDIYKILKSAL